VSLSIFCPEKESATSFRKEEGRRCKEKKKNRRLETAGNPDVTNKGLSSARRAKQGFWVANSEKEQGGEGHVLTT